MAATPLHVGDIGAVIRLTVFEDGAAKDISAATTKQIKIIQPDGTVVTRTGSFSATGTDGRLQCTTQTSDLSVPGLYQAVAYLVIGGFTGHSTPATITVKPVGQ